MKPAATVRTMSSVEAKVGVRERARLSAARKRPSKIAASQRPELSVWARGSKTLCSAAQRSRASFQSAAKPFRSRPRAKHTIIMSRTSAAGSRMASLRKCFAAANRAKQTSPEAKSGRRLVDPVAVRNRPARAQKISTAGRMVAARFVLKLGFSRYFPTWRPEVFCFIGPP